MELLRQFQADIMLMLASICEFLKEAQKREHTLFEQTAEALASAIDANIRIS